MKVSNVLSQKEGVFQATVRALFELNEDVNADITKPSIRECVVDLVMAWIDDESIKLSDNGKLVCVSHGGLRAYSSSLVRNWWSRDERLLSKDRKVLGRCLMDLKARNIIET